MQSPSATPGQRRGFKALGRRKVPSQHMWVFSWEGLGRFSIGDNQLPVQAVILKPFLSTLRWERSQPVHLMFESNEATFNKTNPGSVAGPLLLLLPPVGLLSRLLNNLDKCS